MPLIYRNTQKNSITLIALLLMASSGAIAAPHADCKGLYVGKAYSSSQGRFMSTDTLKIVGLDKDENLVSVEVTAGHSGAKENYEVSCSKIKQLLSSGDLK